VQKQDKIRNELLLLPTMSRIKIRVSAGVFEVSLLRVIDETKSVEVLWDRGVKREFKWGSVVFGNTDGQTIGQKPTELVTDAACKDPELFNFKFSHQRACTALPSQSVMSFPPSSTPVPSRISVPQNQNSAPVVSFAAAQHPAVTYAAQAAPNGYPAGTRDYQYQSQIPGHYPNVYPHASSVQRSFYQQGAAPQQQNAYQANQYRSHLQWQQPYRGPPVSSAHYHVGTVASEGMALNGVVYSSPQPQPMETMVEP
jgi:hypothetical protein